MVVIVDDRFGFRLAAGLHLVGNRNRRLVGHRCVGTVIAGRLAGRLAGCADIQPAELIERARDGGLDFLVFGLQMAQPLFQAVASAVRFLAGVLGHGQPALQLGRALLADRQLAA